MSFQILNENNEAIDIAELDKQACEFWGKEIHPKSYATPTSPRKDGESELDFAFRTLGNWFDVIGWSIHNQGHKCAGWSNIVATMMVSSLGMKFIDTSKGYNDRPVKVAEFEKQTIYDLDGNEKITYHLSDELEMDIFGVLQYYKPYIALINHWKSKGYIPKQIKE